MSRKNTCCLTTLAYSVPVRFLVQYLLVSVALVALAWGAAAVEVNGKTLVGHFLNSRVGTKVQTIVKKVVKRLTTRAATPAFGSWEGGWRASVPTLKEQKGPPRPPAEKPKPQPVAPKDAARAPPATARTAAALHAQPWRVQTAEGAQRRVTLLERASRQLADSNPRASN